MGCLHPTAESAGGFSATRLEQVFNRCFSGGWETRLLGGADEPYYQPARGEGQKHALYYRNDYFASALHEIAHWCIAGDERRLQPDFGYWYTPGDRDMNQQQAFEAVEARPQALEWIFSKACGYRFRPSADNLDLAALGLLDTTRFNRRVLEEARVWQERGLPTRADMFYRVLCDEFCTRRSARELQFDLCELE